MIGGAYNAGIAGAEKSEYDGVFILNWIPKRDYSGGDLGCGGCPSQARFLTEEGRTYFIQAEALREKCNDLAGKLACAERRLKEIDDRREARRQMRLSRSVVTTVEM